MGLDGFITIDSSITSSKSGLYVTGLPGVTVAQLDGLTKDEQADFEAFFTNLYNTAQVNLKIDVQRELAQRFHIDKKLVSRETSKFLTTENDEGGLAGVLIEFCLPRYARIHIVSISVRAIEEAISPVGAIYIYDDQDGTLLDTVTAELEVGENLINVNQDFTPQTDKLFVAFNTDSLRLYKTENRYFASEVGSGRSGLQDLACTFPCGWGEGSIQQINGGGLNVRFNIYCSLQKLIEENVNLFQYALWYRIGVDLMKERIVSDRVNRFVVLTEERATSLMAVFNEDYQSALKSATMNIKMTEDPICFNCKRPITAVTSLP